MPYLHFETESNYEGQRSSALAEWKRKLLIGTEYEPGKKGNKQVKAKDSRPSKIFQTESKKPTSEEVATDDTSAVMSSSNCHPRRTLDQSYYFTLSEDEMSARDRDQVVSRYSTEVLGKEDPYILMVDQLWLWVVDTSKFDPSIYMRSNYVEVLLMQLDRYCGILLSNSRIPRGSRYLGRRQLRRSTTNLQGIDGETTRN